MDCSVEMYGAICVVVVPTLVGSNHNAAFFDISIYAYYED